MRLQLLSVSFIPFLGLSFAFQSDQMVLTTPDRDVYTPQSNYQPTLADLLTIESSASIFYSYARETELSTIFGEQGGLNATLLVPTNKAVMALSRKPHQDPVTTEDGIEISDQEFDIRSKRNVERWVSAHIIPRSPIALESQTYQTLLDGKSISFEPLQASDKNAPEWTRVLLNGHTRIIGMKEGSNGVLYLIEGTVTIDN